MNLFFPKTKQKPNKLNKRLSFVLFCTFIFASFFAPLSFALDTIKSDWELEPESEKKPPLSAIEFENREERLRKLQQKKLEEEQIVANLKADISRRRKVLIECLNQKGVILFSIEDCDACETQKAYFGDDFATIKYVDCNQARFTCPFRGIKSYPTWYLGSQLGIKKEGVQDLPSLARLTNCEF